jgi:hypothetical protein
MGKNVEGMRAAKRLFLKVLKVLDVDGRGPDLEEVLVLRVLWKVSRVRAALDGGHQRRGDLDRNAFKKGTQVVVVLTNTTGRDSPND